RRDLEVAGETHRSFAQTRSAPAQRTTAEVEEMRRTTTLPFHLSSTKLRIPALLILVALTIGALVFLGYRFIRRTPAAASRFQRINVTKMTTNGNAAFAAISHDGKYLAYVMNEGGRQSLWLRQVAVESNVRLLPAKDGNYLGIAFSPDGNYIYYGYVEG